MLFHHFNWKTLSLIAGLTIWNFYFEIFEEAIRGEHIIVFLTHLLRSIRCKLTVVWDGLPAHRGKLVWEYLDTPRMATADVSGGNILQGGAGLVVVYQPPGLLLETVMIDGGNISIASGVSAGTVSFSAFTAAGGGGQDHVCRRRREGPGVLNGRPIYWQLWDPDTSWIVLSQGWSVV